MFDGLKFQGNAYFFLALALTALVIAAAATPLIRSLAYRFGALDYGRGRRAHVGVVPRLGGGGIYCAFLVPMVFGLVRMPWTANSPKVAAVLVAATLVFAVGVWDDLRGATIRNKLTVEVAAALLIWLFGMRIEQLTNPFGAPFALGWMSLPVTVLWVVVITNAINLVDGLDGLAGVTGIMITASLFLLAPHKGSLFTLMCVALIGSLLGFLIYNFPPASIFMGDSGSLLLGFLLASLSILMSAKATAMATIMLPILAFSHPLMDMSYAILRRYHRGLPLGSADKEHIHHKLLEMGISKRTVLLVLGGMNGAVMVAALLFMQSRRGLGALGILLPAVMLLLGLRLFGYVRIKSLTVSSVKLLLQSRQRRYCGFLVRRFREAARSAATLPALCDAVRELLDGFGYTHAELRMEVPGEAPRNLSILSGAEGQSPLLIDVPILDGQRALGRVRIAREIGAEALVGSEELTEALSRGIGECLARIRK